MCSTTCWLQVKHRKAGVEERIFPFECDERLLSSWASFFSLQSKTLKGFKTEKEVKERREERKVER